MKKRLLAVQGPLQFITGYVAFDWYRRMTQGCDDGESVLLLYDFLAPPEIESAIAESVMQLTRQDAWSRVVFLRSDEMAAIMRGKYTRSIERLHEALGSSHFDEIFLARDHVGDGSPLLINAYPDATRLAYGDSFGLVGQRGVLETFDWSSPVRSLVSVARRSARRMLWGGPRIIPFDAAVLTLPLDLSGIYLDQTRLVVPPREHVLRCIEQLTAPLDVLRSYCRRLVAEHGTGAGDHLYLLSNLSASGLTSTSREIDLYVEVIEQTARPGTAVFIKHHPRSSHEVLRAVVQRVEKEHRVIVLNEPSVERIPVELWQDLIAHCTIVAMFSTSAINMKYLYGKEVVIPLDAERIGRFFPRERVEYMASGTRMIQEAIGNLDHWDEKSVLWAKSR